MTGYKQGDVILVAFPFEERAGGRKRPALVVSPPQYNKATDELIIAQITSHVTAQPRPGDHLIQDWKEAKLPSPAIVRARLATMQTGLVLRRLGGLSEADLGSAMAAIHAVIGPLD